MRYHIKESLLAGLLMVSILAVPAVAQSPVIANPPSDPKPVTLTADAARNEKVRSDVSKMVAEAKAGRTGPPRNTQFSPPHSNNLSKTAKIAIVAGIALVIIAIVIVHGVKNSFHCESRCVI